MAHRKDRQPNISKDRIVTFSVLRYQKKIMQVCLIKEMSRMNGMSAREISRIFKEVKFSKIITSFLNLFS